MTEPMPRRDFLKTAPAAVVALSAGSSGVLSADSTPATGAVQSQAAAVSQAPVLPLTSTSDVFVPPRGRGFMKFSFDFPEPSVEFAGLRFGFMIFTRENAYGLAGDRTTAIVRGDTLDIECTELVWAGGQQRAPGTLRARFRQDGAGVTWSITAEMDQPIKTVTTVIRDVPRGRISAAGGTPSDPGDDELLFGYPFSGGDLHGGNSARGLTTPFVSVATGGGDFFSLASLDDHVRTKRFYFQPGETAYRVEAVYEAEGWLDQTRLEVAPWRLWRTSSLESAVDSHYDHLQQAYRIPDLDTRRDMPEWARQAALAVTLHGMHYTGYIFNDYARMLEILEWIADRIPPERVIAFLSSWDGRYYWDYPLYQVSERMGGEAGFRRLVERAQALGFKVMPMFGANSANRQQPAFANIADSATRRLDDDPYLLNWVDWDNDRHQEAWLAYMNLGVDSWRRWLTDRIASVIVRYGVDAYFLDIVAGWVNNSQADMHEGTRRLVLELRDRYPDVLCCGEFHYDGLLEFIPLYHVALGGGARFARAFSHLSHPAPGRGSTGVHEAGFGRFDPVTLSLSEGIIPTLNVVDDTFTSQRDAMAAIIQRARQRAGI